MTTATVKIYANADLGAFRRAIHKNQAALEELTKAVIKYRAASANSTSMHSHRFDGKEKCTYCGQWGEHRTACSHCGAPIS